MNWRGVLQRFGRSPKAEVRCFPEVSEVFRGPAEELKLVFHPLCSVRHREVTGDAWFHFVDRWSNGDAEPELFDAFHTRNGLAFERVGEQYRFAGELSRFPRFDRLAGWYAEAAAEFGANREAYLPVLDHAQRAQSKRSQREDARSGADYEHGLYVDQVISYLVARERYRRAGKLNARESYSQGHTPPEQTPYEQLGGQPEWEQHDTAPAGEAIRFIGRVTGHHYLRHGSDNIYLFHDVDRNSVHQVFQYG